MSMCGYRDEEEEHKIGDRNPLMRTMAFFLRLENHMKLLSEGISSQLLALLRHRGWIMFS